MFNKMRKKAGKADHTVSKQERQHMQRCEKNREQMRKLRQEFVDNLFDLGYHIVPRIMVDPNNPTHANAVINCEPMAYAGWKKITEQMAEQDAKSPIEIAKEHAQRIVMEGKEPEAKGQ